MSCFWSVYRERFPDEAQRLSDMLRVASVRDMMERRSAMLSRRVQIVSGWFAMPREAQPVPAFSGLSLVTEPNRAAQARLRLSSAGDVF